MAAKGGCAVLVLVASLRRGTAPKEDLRRVATAHRHHRRDPAGAPQPGQPPDAVEPGGAPPTAIYLLTALGVLGLIGAVALWMLKRWALWLTIVVSVLNILVAAPGLVFAPTATLKVLASVGAVGFAVVILLAMLPNSRRAYG